MYIYATYLTIVFYIAYFKRLAWTAVLIIISPFVCVTYAFSKNKSTFSKWLREYTVNVFIQPYHLIVYTVLFKLPLGIMQGSNITEAPWGAAINNPVDLMTYIYALISITMIRPSEKFIRKLFEMNGEVANKASFESGKQTLEVGKEVAAKVATVVSAVATGNVTGAANALGATGGNRNGIPATVEDKASGATNIGEGENNTAVATLNGPGNNDMNVYGQEFDPYYDDYVGENPYESNFDNPPLRNPVWSDEYDDYVEAEELNNSKTKLGENNSSEPNKNNNLESNENKEKTNTTLEGNNLSSILSNSDTLKQLHLDSAINKVNEKDNKLDDNARPKQRINDKINDIKDKFADTKLGRLGSAVYQKAEKTKDLLNTPEVKSSFNELGKSLHKLTDTMYIDPPDRDWEPNYNKREKEIEGSDKKRLEAFVNNTDNINYIMQMNGDKQLIANIKDPVQKKKAEKTAKEDAKKFLESGEPYLKYGINNVEVVASLLQKQKEDGTNPRQTIKNHVPAISNEIKVKQEAFAPIQQIIAKETGNAINSTAVLNQTQSVVNQASPYIQKGNSDPEVLNRLVKLENDLKSGRFTQIASNPGKVIEIDKVIQKAIKENVEKIKLPEANNNKNIKALNDFMNNSIQKEKNKQAKSETKTSVKEIQKGTTKTETKEAPKNTTKTTSKQLPKDTNANNNN